MADITIPGTQSKVSKPVAIAGLAAVGVLIVMYYRNKSASAATAAATASQAASSTDQYPADGTTGDPSDPYSTDPATGQTYGNEAAGSGGTYGAYGTDAASGLYYDPETGAYDLSSPYGTTTTTEPYQTAGGPPFSDNSAWSDWVIQELQAQNSSIDVGALTDALGLYLAGQPLTPAQKQYVFDAQAIGDNPPVAGPDGYPPNVKSEPGSTSGTHQVAVPDVIGTGYGAAVNAIRRAGLKVPATPRVNSNYVVTRQSPAAGTEVESGSTVTLTAPAPAAKATTVTVPDVVGQKVGAAHNELVRAGLTVGNRPNSNYTVTAITPGAGSKVPKGRRIDITARP